MCNHKRAIVPFYHLTDNKNAILIKRVLKNELLKQTIYLFIWIDNSLVSPLTKSQKQNSVHLMMPNIPECLPLDL